MLRTKSIIAALAPLVLTFAACSDVVEVKVQPTKYVIGTESYELANTAVDELLKRKSSTIRIYICPDTPVDRVIKFNIEWAGRLQTKPELALTDAGC